MKLSAALATDLSSPEHVAIAEDLGYRRAWLYDTPQQSPDVWMCLALAAQRTTRIGLGPGVLVPTLRHPMVNAAAAAALEQLAPNRVAVAFGTGFTGRRAMGQPKPIPWSYMARYIGAFTGLLRGEIVEWEDGALRMLHPAGSIPAPPIEIPVHLSALGPKGLSVAKELADGLFVTGSVPDDLGGFTEVAYLAWGTVLDDDEPLTADRVRSAAGPGLMQTMHGAYEGLGAEFVATLPGGPEWLAVLDRTPEAHRHLAVHEGHCMTLNEADAAAWQAGASALVADLTLTGPADRVRDKVEQLAERGVTDLLYQPVGDIRRELEKMAVAVEGIGA